MSVRQAGLRLNRKGRALRSVPGYAMKRLAFGHFQKILVLLVVAAIAAEGLLPVLHCASLPVTADSGGAPVRSTDACTPRSAMTDSKLREP